jgi:hypothetical protein
MISSLLLAAKPARRTYSFGTIFSRGHNTPKKRQWKVPDSFGCLHKLGV